jgi:hypothetical protein
MSDAQSDHTANISSAFDSLATQIQGHLERGETADSARKLGKLKELKKKLDTSEAEDRYSLLYKKHGSTVATQLIPDTQFARGQSPVDGPIN